MSFRNFTTGHGHSFGGQYLELVPNELLRYDHKFEDPNLPGEILGWQESLRNLAILVEPEITP